MAYTISHRDDEPSLATTLTDAGVPIDLSGYSDIEFLMEDEYERVVIEDDVSGQVNVIDPESGEVEYKFDQNDTVDIGTYYVQWKIFYDTGGRESVPSGDGRQVVEIGEGIEGSN